ncbi:hypothetical protein [Brevundimonas sp. 374]|uniref:hypothetical protein n=1 Tax=Brevundimonas sp. 374 TaxID=1150400 RepID=UPI000892631B|nr:hypothetical protein [Brevundimonas sp. 374]SDR14152.1 hypothetical protein SAMN02787020_2766 [Brevundimonas sp. 374]
MLLIKASAGALGILALLFLCYVAGKKGVTGSEMASWVQAVFAVVAIGASAVFFARQQRAERRRLEDERRDTARSAGEMSAHALNLVAVRLEACLHGKALFNLRGAQTTEMVQAMRELELGRLDPNLIKHFAYLRAGVFAINTRITEIYTTEKTKPSLRSKRTERLKSAARVLDAARQNYRDYQDEIGPKTILPIPDIPSSLDDFLREATAETQSHPDAYD